MLFDHGQLIEDLIALNQAHQVKLDEMQLHSMDILNMAPEQDAWSALQCVQHLTLSLDFYIPEMREQIGQAGFRRSDRFRSGVLGNMFAKSMWPSERSMKSKTLARLVPEEGRLNLNVIHQLKGQMAELGQLIDLARDVDLRRTRTSTLAGSWLKLRLGDGFRVVVYHNERHLRQAERAIEAAYK